MTTDQTPDTAPAAAKSGAYDPRAHEDSIYAFWEAGEGGRSHFAARVEDGGEPYSIVIPPPNVTGALHMGHALNNTIQDVLIRHHRMAGFNACWVPGTDHAGIATQSVVERRLFQAEGKTRHDLGRAAMIERIWKWKDEYETRILGQLKRMGCSCDWDRTAFTMSDTLSAAVRHVFIQLFKRELIYRGQRLINWCPGCRTALSNDELEHEEVKTNFWHLKYPLLDDPTQFIEVATTRPETMLGDTAVAVHPNPRKHIEKLAKSDSESERGAAEARLADADAMARLEMYASWIGRTVKLPLMDREIPIVGDDVLADPLKGTGAVKVTPAHDPNDYACGLRHNLPMINILNDDGTLNDNAGEYAGLHGNTEGRKRVVADLTSRGNFGHVEDLTHSVAHCYRSHDVVEPYLSHQWFVKMGPLVDLARNASEERRVTFFPPAREKVYLDWLANTPDWCISRQIWWGHRIPIWYCTDCNDIDGFHWNAEGELMKVPGLAQPILPPDEDPHSAPTVCPTCKGASLVQDPDVLDTWFSSQLWPLSTFGWPDATDDLRFYYPTNVLVTARDIIALWVARMVMMGELFSHEFLPAAKKTAKQTQPFHHVFITPTVLDEVGDIMSKSRGNGFDPVAVILGTRDRMDARQDLMRGGERIPKQRIEAYPTYGADAMRFALMSMCTEGQDIKLLVERKKIDGGDEDGLPAYDVTIPKFEEARRFGNKLWQVATGVVFRQLSGESGMAFQAMSPERSTDTPHGPLSRERPEGNPQPNSDTRSANGGHGLEGHATNLPVEDRWLNHRLHEVTRDVTDALRGYRMAAACKALYDFTWNDYCSYYVEVIKPRLWGEAGEESQRLARTNVLMGLNTILRLLHPFMPYITEVLFKQVRELLLKGGFGAESAMIRARWPRPDAFAQDADALRTVDLSREITLAINRIRAEQPAIKEGQRLPDVQLVPKNDAKTALLEQLVTESHLITKLAKIDALTVLPSNTATAPAGTAIAVVDDIELRVPLTGLVDFAVEIARIDKQLAETAGYLAGLEKKLGNEAYTSRAPADVVQRDREKLAEMTAKRAALQQNRDAMAAAMSSAQ